MTQAPKTPQDENPDEVHLTVTFQGEKIIMDFGKSISWIGFNCEEAESLAVFLLTKVSAIRKATAS